MILEKRLHSFIIILSFQCTLELVLNIQYGAVLIFSLIFTHGSNSHLVL